MDFEKYTERVRGFIQSAHSMALREGNPQFTPEHLLKVLLDDDQGLASGLINAAGGDARQALKETEAALASACCARTRRGGVNATAAAPRPTSAC